MSNNARAGTIWVQVDGQKIEAKGEFTIQPGQPKREAIVGVDGIHGHKETPQVPYVEGATTDRKDFDTVAFRNITGATVTVRLANGKTWVYSEAWYASEGTMTTGEGEIGFRFESAYPAKEI
ncbi:MAG: phage tail tube protein [Deltaproteobacteria bacterium]|nr:phage tail tube protein [Deltaproteobacteria bacterium]